MSWWCYSIVGRTLEGFEHDILFSTWLVSS